MSSMRQLVHQKKHVEELTFRMDFIFNFGTKGQVLCGFSPGSSNSTAFNRLSKAAPRRSRVPSHPCGRRARLWQKQNLMTQRFFRAVLHSSLSGGSAPRPPFTSTQLVLCSVLSGLIFGTKDSFAGLDRLHDRALLLCKKTGLFTTEVQLHFTLIFIFAYSPPSKSVYIFQGVWCLAQTVFDQQNKKQRTQKLVELL